MDLNIFKAFPLKSLLPLSNADSLCHTGGRCSWVFETVSGTILLNSTKIIIQTVSSEKSISFPTAAYSLYTMLGLIRTVFLSWSYVWLHLLFSLFFHLLLIVLPFSVAFCVYKQFNVSKYSQFINGENHVLSVSLILAYVVVSFAFIL